MGKFKAITEGKCPQCRSGKMFKYPPLNIKRFSVMHDNCPCCKLAFCVEPGFFIGAMYISYALAVGLVIVVELVVYGLFGYLPLWINSVMITSCVILFLPWIFRFSRILFLHLFGGIGYNPLLK